MRTVEEYLKLPWMIVVRFHSEDGGYWSAEVAELTGCMYATRNRDELLSELHEVMRMWIEDCLSRGESVPEPAATAVS